jgi:Protein of unknown function (DUF2723)
MNFKTLNNLTGWLVFAIAFTTYALSAEPTGSLWDCGEFIAGAHKLQVVHPPGAPFFLLVGRMFTWVAELFSANKANIAYSVNLLSGVCTAFAALFMCWATTIFSRLMLSGREQEPTGGESIAVLASGLVAGLTTTFAASVWFSAVEGEVYAMSLFFTAIVIWAMLKWYFLDNSPQNDRWIIFSAYMIGLSIGVHLLSLLAIPALTLLYYYKNNKGETTTKGFLTAGAIGVGLLAAAQVGIIKFLPGIGGQFDYYFNMMGLPPGIGLLAFIVLLMGGVYWGLQKAQFTGNRLLERILLIFAFVVLGFSTYAVIMIRAKANTPINMNNPSDPFSLLSYLNREQYGDRPLVYGPHFAAEPIETTTSDKYGVVDGKYEVVDKKYDPVYDPADMMLFPRIGHSDRMQEHLMWMGESQNPQSRPTPTQADNISFFVNYQIMWEYWRYFMWNFAGRQNTNQGYFSADPTDGNWISGINAIDNPRLYDQSILPQRLKDDAGRNVYYMLPFLFGMLGMVYQFLRRNNEWWVVFGLFMMLGVAIILYSNQPPNEPRERDYAIAGSMMIFAIWVGLGVTALFDLMRKYMKLNPTVAALAAGAIVMIAPILMGTQNWDDQSRAEHYGARDYASNFLNSCAKDAIVFTFGDNDTYPLWYAQEVEGIRTDVRVVNLSLLAVDWYIDQLRRKVNQSPAIKMTIAPDKLRGYKRNQVFYPGEQLGPEKPMNIKDVVKFLSEDHPLPTQNGDTETYLPTRQFLLDVDVEAMRKSGAILPTDSVLTQIPFNISKKYIIKDEVAILDILASNLWERPIYFAVTCTPDKMLGLNDYTQLEGLALRIIPVKSKGRREFGGMLGGGRVASNTMYDNVINKFKWGNFDKIKTHIDHCYFPSVISTRYAMLRLAEEMLQKGEMDKAVKVVDKYFEAFPNMNFQYDYNTIYFLKVYADAAGLGSETSSMVLSNPALKAKLEQFGGKAETIEKLKKHLEILAKETGEMHKFYANPAVSKFFGNDLQHIEDQTDPRQQGGGPVQAGSMTQIKRIADDIKDAAFKTKIEGLLK